jgi:hypothetical protein
MKLPQAYLRDLIRHKYRRTSPPHSTGEQLSEKFTRPGELKFL